MSANENHMSANENRSPRLEAVKPIGAQHRCQANGPSHARTLSVIVLALAVLGFFAVPAWAGAHVVVAPSSDLSGVTDADNIEHALRQAHGGGTVELLEGDYYISRAIGMHGFTGTLMGQGRDETFIRVLENHEPNGYLRHSPYNDFPESWGGGIAEYAIVFNFEPHSYLARAPRKIGFVGFTIIVDSPSPATSHYNIFLGTETTALNNILAVSGGNYDVSFEEVRIQGGDGDADGYNLIYPVVVGGGNDSWLMYTNPTENTPGVGAHRFVDFEVSDVTGMGVEFWNWQNTSIEVESASFANVSWGIQLAHLYDCGDAESTVVISDSAFTGIRVPPDIKIWTSTPPSDDCVNTANIVIE